MSEPRTDAPGALPAHLPEVPRDVRGPYAPPPGAAPAAPPPAPSPAVTGAAGPGAANAIARYRPPRSRLPLLVAFGLGVALVGVLAASGVLNGVLPGTAASGATPTASGPAAQPSMGGVAFSMPNDSSATGRWEVLERVWDADGVDVRVRVYCSAGEVEYGFRAFSRGSSTPVRSEASARTPGIDSGTLAAGETAEGWLRLALPREEATFFITTLTGRMMSAQALKP